MIVGLFTDRDLLQTHPGADWRLLVLKRTSRLLAAVSVPGILIAAATPGPYGLRERVSLVGIAAAMVLTAWLARDARRFRAVASFLTGTIMVVCLGLVTTVGMGPGLALALGSCLVLVAIFFGNRAVWGVAAATTLALLGIGAANRAGLLHPVALAAMFDWTKMSICGGALPRAMSRPRRSPRTAVAMVIAHLEEESSRSRPSPPPSARRSLRTYAACSKPRNALASGPRGCSRSRPRCRAPARPRRSSRQPVARAARRWTASPRRSGGSGPTALCVSQAPGARRRTFSISTGSFPWARTCPLSTWSEPVSHSGSRPRTTTGPASLGRHAGTPSLPGRRSRSFCLFPLAVDGVVKGVVAFVRRIGHRFDDDERAYYATISLHCAQALERAILHDAARELALRAEAANRLKDEFLSTVGHELRTPLNAIMGWLYMLRSDQVPADRREHALQVIDRNARAQAKLVADLLDVNLIRAGRLRMHAVPVEPAVLVQMAIDSLRPAADANGVVLAAFLETNEPVLGDAGRLHQIVCNLMANAVKFSPHGGRVDIAVAHEPPEIVISVRDYGEGIEPEFLPFLFEPFRQAEGGVTRSHGGLGLGLTITKRLVQLHGGTIQADSEGEGRGATFVVRLPSASGRPVTRPGAPAFSSESIVTAGPPLRGLRVLVVEDEPDTRELLLALFGASGAYAYAASSAAEAIELFHREKPEVVVSDVGLRGEDGLDLVRRLRSLPGGDIPVVALTAFARSEDREYALAAGFDAHVTKPVAPERLLHVVAEVLRERLSRERARA